MIKLIAHNGSRFDLPALQRELFRFVEPEQVKAIRKGCSFISLTIENILCFIDSMNFVPGMSLSKFSKTFNVEEQKGVWPYEYFSSLQDIMDCKEYPPIEAFYSSLMRKIDSNQIEQEWNELKTRFSTPDEMNDFFGIDMFCSQKVCVSPKDYFFAKTEYNEKRANGEYESMLCVLKFYNLSDCRILFEAMKNFIKMVKVAFGADVLSKMTLPALAEGNIFLTKWLETNDPCACGYTRTHTRVHTRKFLAHVKFFDA